jgi:Uma2 family endonuclease
MTMKMTARQFLMLGEDPPGCRLELVHGDIVVSPSPSYEHSFTDTRLRILLGNHIAEHDLGELVGDVDTIFDEDDVRRPDIIFTAKERAHLLRGKGHGIHIAPDLCIEIISPGSADYDQGDKFELYGKSGVANFWLVDPEERTFVAYRLNKKRYTKTASGRGKDTVSAAPFPKLKIPLSQIWLPS